MLGRVQHGLVLGVILGLLLWGSCPAWGQEIVRGPYLQKVTPSSITVVWRTATPTDGLVRFGTSLKKLDRQQAQTKKQTQHEVTIEGLKPATRYFYRVGTRSKMLSTADDTHYFRTSPVAGSAAKTRLWIVGDSGTGSFLQKGVRDAMLKVTTRRRPDLFLHMGDMAYSDGTDKEFQRNFFNIYQPILSQTTCWPTLGNHEGRSSKSGPQQGPYYDAYVLPKAAEAGGVASGTEAYYSFDYANIHFVVLDSHDSSRDPKGAMLTWLQQDLAATKQTWLIAYWHHPPYSKGSHDSDKEGQLIEMRENVLPILEAAGVDLVLSGHSHTYERSYPIHKAYDTPTSADGKIKDKGDGKLSGSGAYQKGATRKSQDGAVYIVAGHGGTLNTSKGKHPLMFHSETDNGSCLIDVQGNVLRLRNLQMYGEFSDNFTLVKGKALVVTAPKIGATLKQVERVDIRWYTSGQIAKVDVSVSTDNGESWTELAKGIANTGEYAWSPKKIKTKALLVRVRDSAEPTRFGESVEPIVLESKDTPTTPAPPETGCQTLAGRESLGVVWWGILVWLMIGGLRSVQRRGR